MRTEHGEQNMESRTWRTRTYHPVQSYWFHHEFGRFCCSSVMAVLDPDSLSDDVTDCSLVPFKPLLNI